MDIRTELTNHLEELNKQIEAVEQKWSRFDVYSIQDQSGNYILLPLFVAKAQMLCALASLPTDPMGHHTNVSLAEHYGTRA